MAKSKAGAPSAGRRVPRDAVVQAAEHEREANRVGVGHWALYESHRAQVTAALLRARPQPSGRVALLGAGNCNDVDLPQLAQHFDEVHLVDLDAAAVAQARARVDESVQPKVAVHAPIDLTGLLPTWQAASTTLPTFAEVESWPGAGARAVVSALPGPFDLVASCCVLTQMSWGLRQTLGAQHPMLTQAREALVAAHLRSLVQLAAGGLALFICDMISTEYHPLDELPPDTDLQALMDKLIAVQNFYQGANPVLVRRLLRRDPVLSAGAKNIEWLRPWLWQGPADRTYLVYGVQFAP